MSNNNPNEQNSSIKQALLDLEKVATVSNSTEATKLLKAVKTVLKVLEKTNKELLEADKIFHQHRYNDKKLHFTKLGNFKKSQVVFNLTDKECKILLFMLGIMSQQNMIAIKQNELVKDLRSSKRDISSALKGLEKKGCITKVFTDRKSGLGSIYMVNPEIASVGNHNCNSLFQKITPPEQLNEFLSKTNNCTYGVTRSETDITISDNKRSSSSHTVRYAFLTKPE